MRRSAPPHPSCSLADSPSTARQAGKQASRQVVPRRSIRVCAVCVCVCWCVCIRASHTTSALVCQTRADRHGTDLAREDLVRPSPSHSPSPRPQQPEQEARAQHTSRGRLVPRRPCVKSPPHCPCCPVPDRSPSTPPAPLPANKWLQRLPSAPTVAASSCTPRPAPSQPLAHNEASEVREAACVDVSWGACIAAGTVAALRARFRKRSRTSWM